MRKSPFILTGFNVMSVIVCDVIGGVDRSQAHLQKLRSLRSSLQCQPARPMETVTVIVLSFLWNIQCGSVGFLGAFEFLVFGQFFNFYPES